MRQTGKILSLAITLIACLTPAGPATGCGIHDPTLLARGIMNHVYPESLHVYGAVQAARRTGELPTYPKPTVTVNRSRPSGQDKDAAKRQAFEETMDALYALGLAMRAQEDQLERPDVALVVLDTMLWTRYSNDYQDVREGLHVNGPENGDIVLVTNTPVVDSIQTGMITIARAIELGVIRVYPAERDTTVVLAQLGSLGETPLPRANVALNQFGVSTSDWEPEDPLRGG